MKVPIPRIYLPVDGNGVSDIKSVDALNLAKRVGRVNTPDISGVSVGREVVLDSLRFVCIKAEDAGPFLDRFSVVVGAKGGVDATVVDLETRTSTVVTGVHVLDDVSPVGGGLVDVSLGASGVPGIDLAGGGDEATGGNAGVGSSRSEQLRISTCHDILRPVSFLQVHRIILGRTYGHHGTRAGASDENTLRIGVVLLQSVRDHVGNCIAISATIMLERLLRRDVPACACLKCKNGQHDSCKVVLTSKIRVWTTSSTENHF